MELNVQAQTMNNYENNNQKTNDVRKKTFRFKFTQETQEQLARFADVHKYDNRKTFKEEWDNWINEKKHMLRNETHYLQEMGYDGNVEDKMFKSARYYFKNKKPKSAEEQEPKERRTYIKMNKEILSLIDLHIQNNVGCSNYKPSDGFECFKNKFSSEYNKEVYRIKEINNIDEEIIQEKMKKTYKNRYFNIVNK